MKNRMVSATEFKAKCLALLDDIDRQGGTITVTKRGRPMASVGPARRPAWRSLEGAWVGKVRLSDKLLAVDTADLWEVLRQG